MGRTILPGTVRAQACAAHGHEKPADVADRGLTKDGATALNRTHAVEMQGRGLSAPFYRYEATGVDKPRRYKTEPLRQAYSHVAA